MDSSVTESLRDLFHRLPAPKEVRAAAYQALLTRPNVRSLGTVKDDAGRTGTAVRIDRPQATGDSAAKEKGVRPKDDHKVWNVLIIDTGTMLLLSESGTVTIDGKEFPNKTYTNLLLQVGWTDAAPAVPALP
ncbi:hypothetical protein ACFQYP_49565 [Nonomuraea antimicrobica]